MKHQSKLLSCPECGSSFRAPFGISAVCSGAPGSKHVAKIMVGAVPTVDHNAIDYGIMAWDICDAIALVPSNNIDLGMDVIEQHLPAFIEACLATPGGTRQERGDT